MRRGSWTRRGSQATDAPPGAIDEAQPAPVAIEPGPHSQGQVGIYVAVAHRQARQHRNPQIGRALPQHLLQAEAGAVAFGVGGIAAALEAAEAEAPQPLQGAAEAPG